NQCTLAGTWLCKCYLVRRNGGPREMDNRSQKVLACRKTNLTARNNTLEH
ncbi:hypothetical protein COCCADRAFT_86710, partial [Bipolaris zeicola 26-R-13]